MNSDQNGNRITINLDDIAIPKTGTTFKVQLFPSSFVSPKPLTIRSDQIDKPIAVELEPAAPVALTGRVMDENGRPLEGVQVGRLRVLANGEVDEFWRWHFTGRDVSLPRTDSAGRFRIPDLLPGSTAAVYVNKQGYAGAESTKITLVAGTDGQLGDIRLPLSTRTVQGIVLDYRGKAVAGANVLLNDMSQSRTKTDANGKFHFEKAQHGKLALSVESDEHPVATAVIAEGVNEAKVWVQDPE
jgi:Protocatechuate 3,4-dioxygenase beta subunit